MTRFLTMVVLVLLGTACRQYQPLPATPSPTTASLTQSLTNPSLTAISHAPSLSGVVYESTSSGRRPLAGVGIAVVLDYQSSPPVETTDAEGHYEVSDSVAQNLNVVATKAGYSQPCRASVALAVDNVLDVYLVSDALLEATGLPSSMPILQSTLSGLVFEQTPQGARPIPAAAIVADFSGGVGWAPSAITRSDATGRYLLCGIDGIGPFGLEIDASAPGYVSAEVPINVGATKSVDVELKRQ